MRRKTKLALIGAIAVGVLTVLLINLSTPQMDSELSELRKPIPTASGSDGQAWRDVPPDSGTGR